MIAYLDTANLLMPQLKKRFESEYQLRILTTLENLT